MNAKMLAMLVIGGLLSLSCHAQGTFQNLGFESAVFIPYPGPGGGGSRDVEWMPAFPGWNVSIGGLPPYYALSNDVPLDTSSISIMDRAPRQVLVFPFMQEGNYFAILSAGFFGVSNGVIVGADVELSQTGIVPSGTESLRLVTQPGAANFSVSINGNPLALSLLLTTTNQIVWGADLHGWADQTAELRFTSIAQQPYMSRVRYLYLDDISFSPVAIVPEPSTWALLALGSALLWCAARRRRVAR